MSRFKQIQPLAAIALGAIAWCAAAEDYLGTLKPPRASLQTPTGPYSFSSSPVMPSLAGESGYRLTLGYKYSRYFAVEGEVVDSSFSAGSPFASPANLASAFRSTGFSVDTIATLPMWNRFSLYGRLGAQRGDARGIFTTNAVSLLGGESASRGTRLRYGMGMRYDFTKAFGVHAELERYSPLGSSFGPETETDLFSVGLKWRF